MRKVTVAVFVAALCAVFAAGCSKKVDYNDYISEKRENIYSYSADTVDFTLHTGVREQPFSADGVRGDMIKVAEAYVSFAQNPSEVEISIDGAGGEMNYDSVKNRYSLNFPDGDFSADRVEVTLTCDGAEQSFTALSVLYDGVMDCETALKCVREHAPELFSSMTDGNLFKGEIFIRLLCDEGCYYYVGICDREGKITAYLLDGERGKILAEKKI